MLEPMRDEAGHGEDQRLRDRGRIAAEAAGDIDLDPPGPPRRSGRRFVDDEAIDIALRIQPVEAGRDDRRAIALPGNAHLVDPEDRMQGQADGAARGPGGQGQPPALRDQKKPRMALDRDPRGHDQGLDEVILVLAVEAQIGLHLRERDRLDGGAGEGYRIHAMSPETIDVLRRGGRWAVLALALAPAAAGAVIGGAEGERATARSSVMVLSSRGGVCTAVLVAPDILLTAAHCAAGASEYRIHYKDAAGTPVLIAPAAVKLHPGFSPGAEKTRRKSVDLALVRAPAPLPGTFAPATLSSGGAGAGAQVTVSGYGVAREGDGRSSGTFRSAALSVVEPYGPGKILLWASDRHGRAGACQGDSGGPVTEASGAVLAITSWASGPAGRACGALTQAVLVGPQRAWIDAILSQWGRSALWN